MRRVKQATGTAALAGALAAALLAPGADAVVGQIRAGSDTQLPSANSALSRAKSGPNLAVNPTNPNHIVELHQELETEECEFASTTDGGASWVTGELQAPTTGTPAYPLNLPGPCDATAHASSNIGQRSIAFGSGNNVYISWTSTRSLDPPSFTVLLSKSTDGGATYGAAVEVPTMLSGPSPSPSWNRPEIVINRRTMADDQIYISALDGRTQTAHVTRSDDAGTTWVDLERDPLAPGPSRMEVSNNEPPPVFNAATPPAVTQAGNAFIRVREMTPPVLGPVPSGGGNRPLYVAWISPRNAGACPPAPAPAPPAVFQCEVAGESPADGYLVVAKSTDNGLTWTRNRATNVRGFIAPSGGEFGGSAYPQLEVGRNNEVYVAFNQGPGVPASANCGVGPFPSGAPGAGSVTPCPSYGAGSQRFQAADHFINWDADVWFLRSTNGGTTFGGLKQLNAPKTPGLAAAEITQTRHPLISVAPDGRVDVAWQDRRHWYLNPSDRKGAAATNATVNAAPQPGFPAGSPPRPGSTRLENYRCVHSHSACAEARLGDTYLAHSSDAGASFTESRRVNDRSHNNDLGADYRNGIYWSYGPALVSLGNDRLLVADMDSRLGNFQTDSADVFLRTVDLNAPAGALPTTSIITNSANSPNNAANLTVALSQQAQPGGSEAVHGIGFTNRAVTRPVIVNEADMPAALAGGVLARANLGPLLATPAGGLPANVKAEVDRVDPVGAYIIGGTDKVSAQVEADLQAAGVPATGPAPASEPTIVRITGTPAEIAANIAVIMDRRRAADKALTPPLPAYDAVIIANPNSASAASASALAANRRLPILYVDQNAVPAITASTITALGITKSIIIGSTNVVSASVASSLPNATRLAGTGNGAGYRLTGADGSVYAFGNAADLGSTAGIPLDRPVVGSATTPSGNGYWLVASDGGIFSYGDARFFGSTGGIALNKPVVGMAATPSGNGYWLVASDGGIFAYGDAQFFGSTGGITLNKPVVGMTPSFNGAGYTLVASDGGIFNYGNAQFFGSTGGITLDKPVTGLALSPTGQGYHLVATDGGIFAFGDAGFFGSTGSTTIPAAIVGVSSSNSTKDPVGLSNAVVTESIARGLPRNIVYVADTNEPMHAALLGAAVGRMGGLLMLSAGGRAISAEPALNSTDRRPGTDRIITSDLTGTTRVPNDP